MARRVDLPRLTNRQRLTRTERERRQQAVIVAVFSAILVFALGLAAWAGADRYYKDNLVTVAAVSGLQIPKRDLAQETHFQLVRFYYTYGVPKGSENDPKLKGLETQVQGSAVEALIEQKVLDLAAAANGIAVAPAQIADQYAIDYGQYRVRHILIDVPSTAANADQVDAEAKAKAQSIADQLRADPKNDELWKKLASQNSADPGSKDRGGELGWADTGSYVPQFEDALRTLRVGDVSDPVRTQFGYHVIQVEEKRTADESELVKSYLSYGFNRDELMRRSRYDFLRKEFARRQLEADPKGTAEQVHLAKIVVQVPSPTGGNYQTFAAALEKQNTIQKALAGGQDFAEVAKQHSEDSATAKNGGDMGWVTRGTIVDPAAEDAIFSTAAGKVTTPIGTASEWTIYKVLEKDPAREVSAAQLAEQKQNAYQYWLARQKKAYDVKNLLYASY